MRTQRGQGPGRRDETGRDGSRRAYGYVRVSTHEQAESGLGLEAQRAAIVAYCTKNDLELQEFFEDGGVSGGKPFLTRPGAAELADTVQEGDHVVMRLDRGFRSGALDMLTMTSRWKDEGVVLHVMDLGLDTSTWVGNFVLIIMAEVYALERMKIVENTKAASAALRARGMRVNQYVPFGWKELRGKLVENKPELEAMGYMWAMSQCGYPQRKMATFLNERGLLWHGKPFKQARISDCLKNMRRPGWLPGVDYVLDLFEASVLYDPRPADEVEILREAARERRSG